MNAFFRAGASSPEPDAALPALAAEGAPLRALFVFSFVFVSFLFCTGAKATSLAFLAGGCPLFSFLLRSPGASVRQRKTTAVRQPLHANIHAQSNSCL
jgi:hypothetical protein